MSLKEEEFDRLKRMQVLNDLLQQRVKEIKSLTGSLKETDKLQKELAYLYDNFWQALTDPGRMDRKQKEEIDGMVGSGNFSVVGEDTIWSTLNEIHDAYVEQLKALAKLI